MPKAETIIDFKGPITFATMEMLLNQLRSASQLAAMRKPAKKRLYGTVVETLDNIFKYAADVAPDTRSKRRMPQLKVVKKGPEFIVTAGNQVLNEHVEDLKFKLDRVNQLDDEALKSLYEEVINQEAGDTDNGAGLGLITMALRTEQDLRYSFTSLDSAHSFFTMQITIKE